MDNQKKLNLAKAKQVRAAKEQSAAAKADAAQTAKLESFVRQLSDLFEAGIDINGLDNLDVACNRIEEFGNQTKDLIQNIAKHAAGFHELEIPEQLTVNHVTDERLINKLEQIGDSGELLAQLQAMDEAILLLASAIEKTQAQGKRPQDYVPVRLIEGTDEDLRFITALNFGGGYTSGGGGTTGGSTEAKQDDIITELQTLNSLVPAGYDYIDLSYTGDNLTGVVFKTGGAGGTTISTLTLAYSGTNLTSVTKT